MCIKISLERNGRMSTPTEQAYTELQHAYDFFNTRLFDGHLPPCLITMQRKCHLTHKSATWAKICVTRAKWRRYASNANSMCLHRSSASSAPSLVLSSPTLPTLRHDLIDRRGEVVERASDSVQLLISLASCVLITTFLQLRQPF